MPIASQRARNALVRMSIRLSPWRLLLGAFGSAVLSCSLLLKDQAIQCSSDSDCGGLGFQGWRCDTDGVCIAPGAADAALALDGGALDVTTSDGPEISADMDSGADASEGGNSGTLEASDADEAPSSSSLPDADAGPGLESGARDANASDGPVAAQALYCGLTVPRGITLFNGEICWVGDVKPRGLFCAPASGGTLANIHHIDRGAADAAFRLDAFDLLRDANNIYWSNGQNNQVVRMPLGGQPQQYFTGGDRVSFLAFGAGAAIWATDFADPPASGFGEVVVGPTGGGTSSNAIYTGETGASGVAVNGGNVYWGTSDSLNFGPLTGNAPINRIKSPERPVGGVAVDATGTAYFLAGNRSLYRYVTGAADAKFMYAETNAFGTGDVALDDQNVYFSEPDRGCIMVIAK
jgi:hypothetical protein